jgi:DNA-binding XRE family transcriptional regulator
VDFLAIDRYVAGSRDADADVLAGHAQHRECDISTNAYGLAASPHEYKHCLYPEMGFVDGSVGYIPWTNSLKRNILATRMNEERVKAVFGSVLAEERRAKGLSQEQLSLDAGVDRSFVSEIEQGARQPTLTTLWKLCGPLGVAPSVLVARTEARLA